MKIKTKIKWTSRKSKKSSKKFMNLVLVIVENQKDTGKFHFMKAKKLKKNPYLLENKVRTLNLLARKKIRMK